MTTNFFVNKFHFKRKLNQFSIQYCNVLSQLFFTMARRYDQSTTTFSPEGISITIPLFDASYYFF